MGSFSIWHWLIVLVIVVLVFGTKRLRNLGGDLGGALKSFKSAMREGEGEADKNVEQLRGTPGEQAGEASRTHENTRS